MGELIDIVQFCNSDWYEGNINGRSGFFPANRVQVLDQPEVAEINETPFAVIFSIEF